METSSVEFKKDYCIITVKRKIPLVASCMPLLRWVRAFGICDALSLLFRWWCWGLLIKYL